MDPGSTPGGFSSAIDRIRWRSSWVIFGRPERRRESKRQYPRNTRGTRRDASPRRSPASRPPARSPIWTTKPEAEPEQAIPWTQLGSGVLTLEDADLLPEGDELQSEVMSRAEEGTEPRKKSWAQFT